MGQLLCAYLEHLRDCDPEWFKQRNQFLASVFSIYEFMPSFSPKVKGEIDALFVPEVRAMFEVTDEYNAKKSRYRDANLKLLNSTKNVAIITCIVGIFCQLLFYEGALELTFLSWGFVGFIVVYVFLSNRHWFRKTELWLQNRLAEKEIRGDTTP